MNLVASCKTTCRCLVAWVFVLLALSASAETITGRIVAIADGDTLTLLDGNNKQHKIRLAGIDAPEKKQPFGNLSKQHLSYLVFDKAVSVEYRKHDRYGRIIGKVMVAAPDTCPAVEPHCPKNLDTGLALIAVGLAWHHNQYQNEQTEEDRERYAFAEEKARAKLLGLWADPHPVPPWEFRHSK